MFSDSSNRRCSNSQRYLARVPNSSGESLGGADGFSLIELLVVILIIGILAAIAIPMFLNQTHKGYDASAKTLVGTAETTAGIVAAENNGSYEKVSGTELRRYESSISISEGSGGSTNAWISNATGTKESYSVTATAAVTGDKFTITKSATGQITRTCASEPGKNDCSGAETGTW